MPEVAQRFALPRALWDEGIRRYGFHGISPKFDGRPVVAWNTLASSSIANEMTPAPIRLAATIAGVSSSHPHQRRPDDSPTHLSVNFPFAAGERAVTSWTRAEGSPRPPGATWLEEEKSYNFSLCSRHATDVTLLLYAARDLVNPVLRVPLSHLMHKSGRISHCRLAAEKVADACYYAYSVEGPNNPDGECKFFDPDKVLTDPHCTLIFFPPNFRRSASVGRGSNAGRAPVGVLPSSTLPFDWGVESGPRHASDTIIYEMHVRGFTKRSNSGVSSDKRGTYAGVVDKIPYLKELGVTAVELLPVFQYDPDENNYWGYMPLFLGAPGLRVCFRRGGKRG